nr:hypothetical protein [Gammaproteobacteria bacterium]
NNLPHFRIILISLILGFAALQVGCHSPEKSNLIEREFTSLCIRMHNYALRLDPHGSDVSVAVLKAVEGGVVFFEHGVPELILDQLDQLSQRKPGHLRNDQTTRCGIHTRRHLTGKKNQPMMCSERRAAKAKLGSTVEQDQ